MRTIIVAALGAFGGTLGYAYILNAPKNTILPASFIGLAGYMAYVLLGMAGFGTMSAYFLSTVLVSVVCELLARKMRTPATILLLSALVPLVPGYNFYLAMLALVENRGAAAAREGKTLEEVAEIAQHYADNMASITVKSTDATHPQNGMSFGDLGETDLMEIGAGQHGEGGGVRVPMMSSKDTVATVAEALSKKLELKAGDKAFVMINGCGATTMMEMLVLFKDTVEFLKAKGIEVVASMVGEILTVQEAAGFQMNIAKWDEEMLRLWNTPCRTPAFSKE